MKLGWFFIAIILLFPLDLGAQVNAEAFRIDAGEGLSGELQLSLGVFTGNVKQRSFDGSFRVDFIAPRKTKISAPSHHVFFVGSYSNGVANGESYKDNLFGHLRWVHLLDGESGLEYFAQSQYDSFRDLRQRSLLGLGFRSELSLLTTAIGLGIGAMAEYEDLISGGENQFVFRSTNYLSLITSKWSVRKNMTLMYQLVGYYQPLWTDISDFRVSAESQATLNFTKRFGVAWSLKYLYDSRPPKQVERQDINSLLTLKYNW